MKLSKIVILTLCVASIITSCNKNQAKVETYITDGPGDYESLVLDVVGVSIKHESDWYDETFSDPVMVNILDYANGDKLLLWVNDFEEGVISEVRLVLGEDNTLTLTSGETHDLKVPSGQSSGLKVKIKNSKDVQAGETYSLVIDFNAEKSIVEKGNGTYSLKPVIKAYWESGNGSIEGDVVSSNQTSIYALNSGDTLASAITNSDGEYSLNGLYTGSYNVHYISGGQTKTQNVSVTAGQVTTAPTVNF